MRIQIPPLDQLSFWIGFAAATIFWWLVSALRPTFHQITQNRRQKLEEKRARLTSDVEEHYRQIILRQAQGLHLAAPLFALDEVVQTPLLLAPPPHVEPGGIPFTEDIVTTTVPYLPAWPELAAAFNAPTLTLIQALSAGANIVIVGQPGSGKTVALAYLTSQLARREPAAGALAAKIPILIHIADLELPLKNPKEPLTPILDQFGEAIPVLDLPRFPTFIKNIFEAGQALFLLDGLDELTPDGIQNAVAFLKDLKEVFQTLQIVTTACPEYLDGLVNLGFSAFTLTAWEQAQRDRFCEQWGELWERYVSVEAWAQTAPEVDRLLLNRWLSANSINVTPLELTLMTWSAYAGDLRGARPLDAIETHLRRLSPPHAPREALELLALQASQAAEPVFDPRKARDWIKSFEMLVPESSPETSKGADGKDGRKGKEKVAAPSSGLLSKMAASGLLTQHRNNRMRFAHSVFGGYLAGRAWVNYKAEALLEQPSWNGRNLAMRYLAAHGDASSLVQALLEKRDKPLERNLFIVSRWLRDAPPQAAWCGQVMARLAECLQQNGAPLGLRGQALAAFALSEDPGASSFFRQILQSQSPETLQLAALGSGMMRDLKALEEMEALFSLPTPNVHRAACLALVAIGTAEAIESVGSALLHGDDDLRRAAAEALANHPAEGHAMLKEGSAMSDILVRRAAIYGLARIHQPWSDERLANLQVDDEQWVIRNAAAEIVESKRLPNPHIPRPLPPPSESPWLINFAGKQGLGISPGQPVTDILLLALKTGSEDERLASLTYLRQIPSEGVFIGLYQAMNSGNPIIRDVVFITLWEMAAGGIKIPDPQQFGAE